LSAAMLRKAWAPRAGSSSASLSAASKRSSGSFSCMTVRLSLQDLFRYPRPTAWLGHGQDRQASRDEHRALTGRLDVLPSCMSSVCRREPPPAIGEPPDTTVLRARTTFMTAGGGREQIRARVPALQQARHLSVPEGEFRDQSNPAFTSPPRGGQRRPGRRSSRARTGTGACGRGLPGIARCQFGSLGNRAYRLGKPLQLRVPQRQRGLMRGHHAAV
jgi:hypothetical protein